MTSAFKIQCAVADPLVSRAQSLARLLDDHAQIRVVQSIHALDSLAPLCGVTELDVFVIDWALIEGMPAAQMQALFRATGVTRTLLLVPFRIMDDRAALDTLGVSYVGRPEQIEHPSSISRQITTNVRALGAIRAIEARQRQTQKMEALGRLAAGVAHDFNNQLSVIFGTGSAVLGQLPSDHPGRQGLEEMMKAAGRAATLTRQLLGFSRKQERNPTLLDLNAEVRSATEMLKRLIGGGIKLVIDGAPDLGLVHADAGQIAQIITNLVINARDAMPLGGALTISTSNACALPEDAGPPSLDQPGTWVCLAVRDTGTGMDEETLSHIFEPFFTTKASDKGTGLGLSTVYGIVEQSGGRIVVHSAIDAGTGIEVFLPRVENAPARMRPRSEDVKTLRGDETVLLVATESVVRRSAARGLTRHGYSVLEASDAQEGLRLMEAHSGAVDLLICEMTLPGMSGVELFRRMAVARPMMRVLYLSGGTSDAPDSLALLGQGDRPLMMPFTPQELLGRVRALLDAAGH